MSWRKITDWGKKSPAMLRMADRLGRGTGRFRILDRVGKRPATPHHLDLTNWEKHALAAAWIGHSTILLRIAGVTILTDPVFSLRVGLGLIAITGGPKRLIAPAISIRELPPIDLILISHAHFDHLDRPSLRQLPKETPIVTAPRTSDLITDLGFKNVVELSWGESNKAGSITVTAQQVTHWGARTITDMHRGYNAYLIEGGGKRVLYGGDSAYQDYFKSVATDVPLDLSIVGIAAYDPYLRAHANPEQAWEMAADHARGRHVMAMHHSTFRLSHEPMHEPMKRFLAAAGDQVSRVVVRNIGDVWHEND